MLSEKDINKAIFINGSLAMTAAKLTYEICAL